MVWDTAYINTLPDSCFALIRAGGDKDAGGKTTPRDLRMFPYKDQAGKVDLPHLRNALARLPQANLSDEERARARARLEAAAKAAGVGQEGLRGDSQATHQVIEAAYAPGDALIGAKVDREQAVIRDVTLLGAESKNGYSYTRRAMEEAAKLYEGVHFYADHPSERQLQERKGLRQLADLAGRVRNVRFAGDRVRGDLHLLKGDPLTDRILRIAEQMPELVGNSHRADVLMRAHRAEGGGPPRLVVESVRKVMAMELVTEPATVTSLFEAHTEDDPMDFKTLTLEQIRAERPDLVSAIVDEAAHGDELEGLQADNKALKAKVDAFEAKDRLEARRAAVAKKLEEAKLPKELVTEVFREQLVEAKDDAAVAKLIEDRKALAGVVRPAGSISRERDPDKGNKGGTQLAEADYAGVAQKLGCVVEAVAQ